MAKSSDITTKKRYLLVYVLLIVSLAVVLWGLGLWESKNIAYGFITILFQIAFINIIYKHRESEESMVNYLLVVPTALFMIVIIETISTPFIISVLISLLVLIPIHYLEKYIQGNRAV